MYVYIKSERALWTVGFYDPKGKWISESDHESQEAAAARVHYLNGGAKEIADKPRPAPPPSPSPFDKGA